MVTDVRDTPIEGGAKTVDVIREAGGECEFYPMDVSVWSGGTSWPISRNL